MTPEATSTLLRTSVVVLGAVIVQLAVLTQFRFFGVVPDIIPVLVVMFGLLAGSTMGAATGFAAGMLVDLLLIQTLGVSALLLTIGGYSAGRMRELRDPVHPLVNQVARRPGQPLLQPRLRDHAVLARTAGAAVLAAGSGRRCGRPCSARCWRRRSSAWHAGR